MYICSNYVVDMLKEIVGSSQRPVDHKSGILPLLCYFILFYPIILQGQCDPTDDFETMPFHLVLFQLLQSSWLLVFATALHHKEWSLKTNLHYLWGAYIDCEHSRLPFHIIRLRNNALYCLFSDCFCWSVEFIIFMCVWRGGVQKGKRTRSLLCSFITGAGGCGENKNIFSEGQVNWSGNEVRIICGFTPPTCQTPTSPPMTMTIPYCNILFLYPPSPQHTHTPPLAKYPLPSNDNNHSLLQSIIFF